MNFSTLKKVSCWLPDDLAGGWGLLSPSLNLQHRIQFTASYIVAPWALAKCWGYKYISSLTLTNTLWSHFLLFSRSPYSHLKGSWLKKTKKHSLVSRLSKVLGIFNPQQWLALILTSLSQIFFLILILFWLLWVFIAVCGLSLVVVSRSYTLVAVHGLLLLQHSALDSVGSVVLA